MKKTTASVLVSAGASVALVVAALLLVRGIGADAYNAYRARGGANGFWPWFAKDVCGVTLPGVEDKDEVARREAEERRAKAEEIRKRIAKLEAEEKALRKKMSQGKNGKKAKKSGVKVAQDKAAMKRRHAVDKSKGRGAVKTGGKSSFVAANGSTPYRVNGIRGIEFGSTANAPAEGALPLMHVSRDENGNTKFHDIYWREDKRLTDSVYGFDKAYLNHSIDTEQLSSVSFHKEFPFTEKGMADAVAFYNSMSSEAAADLGFNVIDVDRTGNDNNATICEFRNADSDTSIRGAISAWSDKTLTVSFSVSDKAYSKELRSQSNMAYETGLADSVKAHVRTIGPHDYSSRMDRAAGFLQ